MAFLSALQQALGSLQTQARAMPEFIKTIGGNPYVKKYLPMEGHKFVRGGGGKIQAPIGSELLQGTPYGPGYKPKEPPKRGEGYKIQESTITPTPTGIPVTSLTPYQHKITIQGDKGDYTLPQTITENGKKFDLPQALMENFDDINEATNAARTLKHPMQFTNIPGEQERGVNTGPNRGENPDFYFVHDVPQTNGTIDRGLARINSGTFNEMWANPFWRRRMQKEGINTWDDMKDPGLNLKMARLRLEYGNWNSRQQKIKENPSWRYWYAAPPDLRER